MLTGKTEGGVIIDAIPSCQFEGSPANSPTNWDCGETALYRVVVLDGETLYACEEHVEKLWDRDEAQARGATTACVTKAEKKEQATEGHDPQ